MALGLTRAPALVMVDAEREENDEQNVHGGVLQLRSPLAQDKKETFESGDRLLLALDLPHHQANEVAPWLDVGEGVQQLIGSFECPELGPARDAVLEVFLDAAACSFRELVRDVCGQLFRYLPTFHWLDHLPLPARSW